MKPPKYPVRPAFSKAADALQAWREQQKALLDGQARAIFERIAQDVEKEKRAAVNRFWAGREAAVEAEKGRLLLEKPGVALRMLPSQRMRESLAYYRAADTVRRRHEYEIETIEGQGREAEDRFLREQEQNRERASRTMAAEFKEKALDEALRARAETRGREARDRGNEGRER